MENFFIKQNDICFAGYHLIADFWDAEKLDDPKFIEKVLKEASIAGKCTILDSYFHHFTPNGGVSGVITLAESHISVHTWPECNFAAFDIFMCGENASPHAAIEVLKKSFNPGKVELTELKRGMK